MWPDSVLHRSAVQGFRSAGWNQTFMGPVCCSSTLRAPLKGNLEISICERSGAAIGRRSTPVCPVQPHWELSLVDVQLEATRRNLREIQTKLIRLPDRREGKHHL